MSRGSLAALCLLVSALSFGQEVRKMPEPSLSYRSVYRESQKLELGWPNLNEGETGTFLIFSADLDDADLVVTSSGALDANLKKLKEVAAAVGLPKTDFIVREGRLTSTVDLEFNDAMTRTEATGSFSFPIRRLIEEIEARQLPKPILIAFEGGIESALLKGPGNEKRVESELLLMDSQGAKKWESFETAESKAWWSPLAALTICVVLLAVLAGPIVVWIRIRLRKKKEDAGAASGPQPLTPEEVQAEYDKRAARPWWIKIKEQSHLAFLPIFLLLFASRGLGLETFFRQALYSVPESLLEFMTFRNSLFLMMGMMMLFLLVIVVPPIIRRVRKPETLPSADETQTLMGSTMWPMAVAMGLMMVLFLSTLFIPGFKQSFPQWLFRPLLLTFPIAAMGVSWYLIFRETQRKQQSLPESDPVSIDAREVAGRAGVKVRWVIEKKDETANAFATFFGTVGITSKTREIVPREEIRAILAHEVGHLKAMDVPRLFWMSILLSGALIALIFWLSSLRGSLAETLRIARPLLFILILPGITQFLLAPQKHKAEIAADRFAVEVTGDVELVARALTRIHSANLSPQRLTAWDERMSSHPALTTRLKKLYEAVGQTPPEAISLPPHPPQE